MRIQAHICVLGLDMEWNVPKDLKGKIVGTCRKLAVIQIGYFDDEEKVTKVVIYHVYKCTNLPINLVNLLQHERIKLTGCQVGGDVSKIDRDFRNISLNKNIKAVNLTTMALNRGVSLTGKGLDAVSMAVLGLSVPEKTYVYQIRRTQN